MTSARAEHTATLLSNGKVLVVGGHRFNSLDSTLATAELYDPTTRTFMPTGSMLTPRQNHTATLLSTGQVLITGGFNASRLGLSTAEIYDPKTGFFSPTGAICEGRAEHTATLLDSGKVLIAGGYEHAALALPARAVAELYDPEAGTFSSAGPMAFARGSHTATVLADGTVLIAGGATTIFLGPAVREAEVYDPQEGSFIVDASMVEGRSRHAATALPSGDVLFAGGVDRFFTTLQSAELYTTAVAISRAPQRQRSVEASVD